MACLFVETNQTVISVAVMLNNVCVLAHNLIFLLVQEFNNDREEEHYLSRYQFHFSSENDYDLSFSKNDARLGN